MELSPLPPATSAPSRRSALVRSGGAATLAVVAIVGFVVGAGDNAPGLRLARATTQSISKTLDEVGTVEPVSAAGVSFPVAGTVASIAVAKGTTVTRGQTLATLDTTELERAIDSAQASVDRAKLELTEAIASRSSASDDTSDETASDRDEAALRQAQDAVLMAQQDVDAQLQSAQAALQSATEICATPMEDSPDNVAACRAALDSVLAAQEAVSLAQRTLRDASDALDSLRASAASAGPSADGREPSAAASAADLAAKQKAVDAALAGLAVAKQNVAAAAIVSPIDGVVQDVAMRVGEAVAASSASDTIKVVGPGGFEVTAIVAVDELADVKVGQRAEVVPDGASRAVRGEVVAIGAPITSNGATSYPVSIGVDNDDALRNGTVADVAIVTESAASVVAVPTSAVRVEDGRATVNVVEDGRIRAVSVEIGVIGTKWTEVRRGLRAGDEIVLADLDEPLPGSATSANNAETGPRNGDVRMGPPVVLRVPSTGGR